MKLSPRQCKSARGLLKWNLHDLAFHARIFYKRLEQFEKGTLPLLRAESNQLIDIFKKAGVVFISDLEVAFLSNKKKDSRLPQQHLDANMGAKIEVNNEGDTLKDTTLDEDKLKEIEEEKERKRLKEYEKQKERERLLKQQIASGDRHSGQHPLSNRRETD